MKKKHQIFDIAEQRRAGVPFMPSNCNQIGSYHNGVYDLAPHVVPWSISACNYDADVMLIAQDWNSDVSLRRKVDIVQVSTGQVPALPSNRNLKKLLNKYLGICFCDTYATDLFPFVKMGNMAAPLPMRVLVQCATSYGIPQINAIRPRVVICLGIDVFRALRKAVNPSTGPHTVTQKNIASAAFDYVHNGATIRIMGVTHPGANGIAFVGGINSPQIVGEWTAIAEYLGGTKRVVSDTNNCKLKAIDMCSFGAEY